MTFADVKAKLGVTRVELLALMDNPQFPRPTRNEFSYRIFFDDAAIAAFAATPVGSRAADD